MYCYVEIFPLAHKLHRKADTRGQRECLRRFGSADQFCELYQMSIEARALRQNILFLVFRVSPLF